MDARKTELNRIGDLLKNAFDGRYKNSLLSTHQKPVSVVPNRDFALKQFEFAKIAKKPISQTRVQKPADFDSYWSESTIELIRKLVKEREQYKQNSELVKTQLNDKSSDAAKDEEIAKLREEIATLTQQNANFKETLEIQNENLSTELKESKDNCKKILDDNGLSIVRLGLANGKLLTELKKCNKNLNNCKEDLGKCNEDNNDMKVKIYDCNVEKQNANEEANVAAEWTQEEVEKNEQLTNQLQQKNAENEQLQQNLQTAENKFKLEKAQMDIMFGMKIDLIKKQHEHSMQDAIANISNSSNADLNKQIVDLTIEKQTYQQTIEDTTKEFNSRISNIEEGYERLTQENAKLSNDLIQAQNTNETQKQAMSKQAMSKQANPDKATLAQLQTRVINLTRELLIIKMNEDLQKQKYANFKLTAAPALPEIDRTKFSKRDSKQLNINGGAFKKQLFMKGGAAKKSVIVFDEDKEILVIFDKTDRSLVFQNPYPAKDEDSCVYLTEKDIDEYNKKLKELKDEIDALKMTSTPPVATPDSDTMNKLTAKLIALQTLYKDSQNNLRSEQIKNALNSSIQSTLNSSLTNSNVITDLTKENNNLITENNNLKAEKTLLETNKTQLEGENNTFKTENNNLKIEIADLTSAKTTLENSNKTLETEKTGLTSANQTLKAEKTALESEKTALKAENANLTTRLNTTSTSSGMSTAISNANATLRRIPKGFISDNGRVMFSEHK